MDLFKIMLIIVFLLIFAQDYKDRLVYWFLYLFVGILGVFLQLHWFTWAIVVINTGLNICFVIVLLISGFIYARIIKKEPFLNHSIGTGDVFLFLSICFLFPIVTFILFFVFSLIFSLLVHLLFKKRYSVHQTVPLAGYMSLFFSFVLLFSFFLEKNWLYIL